MTFIDVYNIEGQDSDPYLRVGWVILLDRWAPLIPTKEAGRGSELRGIADWPEFPFTGSGTKLLLGLRG